MPIIARSFDDTLLDTIVSKLNAFADAQAAIDSAAHFYVERDRMRPVTAAILPLVNVYVASIAPDPTQSGPLTLCHETATINLDVIVRGVQQPAATGVDPVAADQVAMRKLYYVKEQVRYALYQLVNATFGLTTIASKKWPRWTVNPERWLAMETMIADGQWTMDIEYEWKPADSQATVLAQLYAVLTNETHAPQPGVLETYGT